MAALPRVQWARLAGLYLTLLSYFQCTYGQQGTYEWDVQVTQAGSLNVTDILAPYTNYTMYVRVRPIRGSPDPIATAALSRVGQVPRFETDDSASSIDPIKRDWERYHQPNSNYWLVPFRTSGPGVTTLGVSGRAISLPGLLLNPVEVRVSVSSMISGSAETGYQSVYGNTRTTIPAGGATSNFNQGRGLQIDFIPSFSPVKLAILNPDTTTIAFSGNNFQTSALLEVNNTAFLGGRPAVCTSFTGIRQAIDLVNQTLLVTPSGVVRVTPDGVFTNILNECIERLAYGHQSLSFEPAFNQLLLAIPENSVRLYMTQDAGSTPFRVVNDTAGQGLGEAFNLGPAAQVLSVDSSVAGKHWYHRTYPVTILVRDVDIYTLFEWDLRINRPGATWTRLFTFPSSVPSTASDGTRSAIYESYDTASTVIPIIPLGIRYAQQPSRLLYIYGTAVLMQSPDGGRSLHLLTTTSAVVTQVVSDARGGLAAITSDNQVFYGEHSQDIVTIQPARTSNPLRTLLVDGLHGIFEIAITPGDSAAQISKQDTLRPVIAAKLRRYSRDHDAMCPFESIRIAADDSVDYTRGRRVTEGALPTNIYLDYGQSYNFTLRATPAPGIALQDVRYSVMLPETQLLDVSLSRTLDYGNNEAVFTISVSDTRAIERRGQAIPGLDYRSFTITLNPMTTNYLCDDLPLLDSAGGRGAQPIEQMTVHLGCPKSKRLEFRPELSLAENEGCSQIEGETCVYFNNDFSPVLWLVDEVTGEHSIYEGTYLFRVIGGGPEKGKIRYFSPHEITKYNLGTATIWTNVEGDATLELSRGAGNQNLSWVCAPGSPCASPAPRQFGKTPEYFVLLQFTTANVNLTTYCNYTHTAILRIHGIAMGFETTLGLTFGTFGALVILTWFFYILGGRRSSEQVAPEDEGDGVPARAALFG